MRLSRPFSILIFAIFTASICAFADDVCELRPDLCGGPVKSKKAKRATNYKNETAREADELEREIILEQQERAGRRAQQQRDSSPLPEVSNSEPAAKPLGFSQVQKAPRSHQAMRDFGRKRPKQIDRSTASVFDAYLDSNAHNPALSARLPSSQNAFQPVKGGRAAPSTETNRPDPVVSGGGFNAGQGPHPENGGFSSKPVTLGSDSQESPGPSVEAPQGGEATSPAGPLH